MAAIQAYAQGVYDKVASEFEKLTPNQKTAVGIVGGAASLYLLKAALTPSHKPKSYELSGGSISKDKVDETFKDYAAAYGETGSGEGIKDRSRTVHLVDVFYSLVTDLYEWGWGQSFHFSPKLPHKDLKASEVAHETRIGAVLGLRPGMKALDCGCGVGGPMRTIAATSGAHVTGITINQYQVDRAKTHNKRQGLEKLTDVVRGDFLNMPFADCTFDGAYAIEATCHAPKLEQVYGEVFRVLKPGSMFVSYEWVSTHKFDSNNAEHVRIIDHINYGNGLPEMRTYKEAENAGKNVGFELVRSEDLAGASVVCGPWYDRLKIAGTGVASTVNHSIVATLDAIGIAPKGLKDVHHMLVEVARSLIAGGETGVFTPMHMLVFRKPLDAKKKAAAN